MRTVKNKILRNIVIGTLFMYFIIKSAIANEPFSACAYALGVTHGLLFRDVSDYSLLKRVTEQMSEEDQNEK